MEDHTLEEVVEGVKPRWKGWVGKGLKVASVGVALTALVLGTVVGHIEYKRRKYLAEFGQVSNPTYTISHTCDGFGDDPDNLAKKIKDLEDGSFPVTSESVALNKKLDKLDWFFSHYGKMYKLAESKLVEKKHSRLARDILQRLPPYLATLERSISKADKEFLRSNGTDSTRGRSADAIAEHYAFETEGPVEKYAKKVFKKLVGASLPKSLDIKDEEIEKAAKCPSSLDGKLADEKLRYVKRLVMLLYTYGHAINSHGKHSWNAFRGKDKEAAILEKACAYAFSDAGLFVALEENKDLGLVGKYFFEAGIRNTIEKKYTGSTSVYASAAEIFYATRQVFHDPQKVFNYLQTVKDSNVENLDSRIKKQIESNRETYNIGLKIQGRIEEMKTRIQVFQDNVECLTKQCVPK